MVDASAASTYLPPLDFWGVLSTWVFEPVPIILTAWIGGLYLLGVRALRARGDSWPVARTISFVVLGLGSFVFATSSGLGAYDTTLLSVHMVQHMVLSMVVPLALALGAPVTLALRTLPAAPRRWLLVVLHSRLARVLTFPPLVLALYVVSPWALYYSGWYPLTLESTYWHEAMHLHLVLVGAMFFWLFSQPRRRNASALFPATVTASTLTPSRSRLMGLRRHSAKESSSRWRAGGMSIRA